MDVKEPFQMYAVISGSKSLRSIIDLHVAGGGEEFFNSYYVSSSTPPNHTLPNLAFHHD